MTTQDRATIYMGKASNLLKQTKLTGSFNDFTALQKILAIALVSESIAVIRSLNRGHDTRELEETRTYLIQTEYPYEPE